MRIILSNGQSNFDITSPLLGCYGDNLQELMDSNSAKKVTSVRITYTFEENEKSKRKRYRCNGISLLDKNNRKIAKTDE